MSYGRLKNYSDAKEITASNVVEEANKAYAVHRRNQAEIRTLWEYYRGKTKILNKTKEIREEINHKINENRAYLFIFVKCFYRLTTILTIYRSGLRGRYGLYGNKNTGFGRKSTKKHAK